MSILQAYARFRMRPLPPRLVSRETVSEESPLRAALLSADQMERQGAELARTHKVGLKPAPDRLLERLIDNRRVLHQAGRMLEGAVQEQRQLTPAAEWLLDNIYLIEEQIRVAQRHLPEGYSRELPWLTQGPSAGFPRVYDIALSAIAHGDGRVDADTLSRFVAAYQSVTPLRLGELWAIPIMLRLALIENLRRGSAQVMLHRLDRGIAESWADRLTEVSESDPKSLVLVLADMVRSRPPMSTSFVAELSRRLQGHGPTLALPLTWMEQWLGEAGHTVAQMVQAENQMQAADQVSISNSIGSIRFLASTDWRDFVESTSLVEGILREDPAGTYAQMDFATRDRYRHMVERLARRLRVDEAVVAKNAVELARSQADAPGSDEVKAHVGYYLIDDGLDALRQTLGPRRSMQASFRTGARRTPLAVVPAHDPPLGQSRVQVDHMRHHRRADDACGEQDALGAREARREQVFGDLAAIRMRLEDLKGKSQNDDPDHRHDARLQPAKALLLEA